VIGPVFGPPVRIRVLNQQPEVYRAIGPRALTGAGGRSTERDIIPPSGRLHHRSDRGDNNHGLIDGYNMSGLVRGNLTASLGESHLVTLQLSPCRVGISRTGHDHQGNRQLTSGAPDLCGTLPNVDDFVRGRLISGGAEPRRTRESTD
jgi:hypothetical protein